MMGPAVDDRKGTVHSLAFRAREIRCGRATQAGEPDPVRVAIIGTPRSGNCWLMHLLTCVYDVPGLFPSVPANVDWPRLPRDCVLILHWRRVGTGLETQLAEHGFRTVVLARHPLDVLISVLHHTLHYPKE